MRKDKWQLAYLITGGSGFIGSYIIRQLLEKKVRVIVYDCNIESTPMEMILCGEEIAKVKRIQGDVCDLHSLLHVIRNENIKKIIHLSAIMFPLSERNPELATRVNCHGTLNIFETARILNLKRIVWASSCSVWGQYFMGVGEPPIGVSRSERPLGDEAPHCPTTVYGATKSLCEFLSKHYFEKFGVDNIGLRMARTYGVGKVGGAGAEFSNLIAKVAKREAVIIPNSGFIRSYAYVEDIARAFIFASETKATKTRVFNTHGFQHYSNQELGDILKTIEPAADIQVEASPNNSFLGFKYDSKNIQKELSYAPSYTFEEGLRKMIDLLR
jgi:nucleoside-diphosphate-sugar epimerase